MHLYDIPIICVLAGLALYAALAGADFGAGLWQLTTILSPRRSRAARERGQRIREHAHRSMGPVWEANHVWLIFVLTVTWTAYPSAFGSIASTLAVPLFIAALGIVFRGTAYALRAGTSKASELAVIDTIFSISSVLTPFALGAVIGAIVSERVPLGNAAGHLFSSWVTPLSALIGVAAVAICAYTAAVYLAADATRQGDLESAERFRSRALVAGALAGAIAIAVLPLLHSEAHRVFTRLTDGPGLVGLTLSALAGLATVALVASRRFELARYSAVLAVVGMILGWALAQEPLLLPHLTLGQAAAPQETLIALIVAIAMGAVILFPSLGLLFSLVLHGRLDVSDEEPGEPAGAALKVPSISSRGLYARISLAGLLGGLGLLTVAEAPWAHGIGVACLFLCMVFGFLAVDPAQLALHSEESPPESSSPSKLRRRSR